MTHLDVQIEPAHQAIAARLSLAVVDGSADRIDSGLSEVAALGMPDALAILAVLARNVASTLTVTSGEEAARLTLERTICEAQVAGDE